MTRPQIVREGPPLPDSTVDEISTTVARCLDALLVPSDAELTVVLTNDARLHELNHQYRKIDGPTDVLSFPADPGAGDPDEPPYLGDVVISIERARHQAEKEGQSLGAELQLLAVHGTLHLLGYDDATEDGADEMEALEVRLGVRAP